MTQLGGDAGSNVVVIDGEQRTFDRVAKSHPKQRQFLIATRLEAQDLTPAAEIALKRGWRHHHSGKPYLDQGSEGACVGFGWANTFNAGPIICKPPLQDAEAVGIYKEAQRHDEWEGEWYSGSSVNGGALALRARGWIGAFRWAWDLDTVVDAVLRWGPVVLGTDWYSGMFRPDAKGVLHASGYVAGGHAYALVGVNKKTGMGRIKNSWGRSWGTSGHAWIPFDDLAKLIEAQGEACIADEICITPELRKTS